MRQPLSGSASSASLILKPLVVMAAAGAALFAAPAAASAAPTGTVSPGAHAQAATSISGTASSKHAGAGIAAVFNCRYFGRPPYQELQFNCFIQSGHLRTVLNCVDGRRISGPTLGPTGYWQPFTISCAPAQYSTFDYYGSD
ncbi:hypothetical protein [Actinomadura terrae]|uniref:hypothetical protein n=1 Tax=Actinomadura terrae TaxID=604353 RepID=UPI001FA6E802|nr:hypothetical protein [Actinomadura terrae]